MVANEIPLVMPKMSMTMTEGVFLTWHRAEGDRVEAGDVVCEVATDKVDMEVEATVAGTLTRLLAAPEDVIPVGDPIAYVSTEADELLGGLFETEPPRREPPPPEPAAPPEPPRAPAVPAARRLAAERGIDLATITPTGPWGTVRLSDVAVMPRKPNRGRAAVARRMEASARVPQFVLHCDLDLEDVRRTHGWTVLLTHAFARALRRHPELNASWVDGALRYHEHVGVALAVDTSHGLLAPVLTNPDRASPGELAGRIADVVERARGGRLSLAELSAPATTTVSNLGGLGVTGFHALLTPPQATALAIGTVEPRVVPISGGVGVRLRCTVGLTVDHRVADGAAGARLLATLAELL
ncbi:dihydrolipoamide acetyltransferase family protein [Actinophytocola sp.]|uniref:dihydrolipoamide acetyltransferase family protein n=1 Tax=Actinophytocola sp. TaxID=1872138 RepID=UPI002ED02BB7